MSGIFLRNTSIFIQTYMYLTCFMKHFFVNENCITKRMWNTYFRWNFQSQVKVWRRKFIEIIMTNNLFIHIGFCESLINRIEYKIMQIKTSGANHFEKHSSSIFPQDLFSRKHLCRFTVRYEKTQRIVLSSFSIRSTGQLEQWNWADDPNHSNRWIFISTGCCYRSNELLNDLKFQKRRCGWHRCYRC